MKFNEEQENFRKVFSYRGYVSRVLQKSSENHKEDEGSKKKQECVPLLHILLGNNYLQSINYEKAIASYKKALELSPFET